MCERVGSLVHSHHVLLQQSMTHQCTQCREGRGCARPQRSIPLSEEGKAKGRSDRKYVDVVLSC